jgi:phage shock protein PspC (stress-responsive transcriptional regulator)
MFWGIAVIFIFDNPAIKITGLILVLLDFIQIVLYIINKIVKKKYIID